MPIETVGLNSTDDWSSAGDCLDTYMDLNNPNDNPDTSNQIRFTWNSATLYYKGLIKFPGLSNISSAATVSAASMSIMPNNDGDAISYSARRMLRAWVIDEVTHTLESTGVNWTDGGGLAGALQDGVDRTGTPEGTDTFTGGVQQYEEMIGLATAAQNWIDGGWDNDGLHLQDTAVAFGSPFRHMISSQGADGSRPYFEVDFTVGGAGWTGNINTVTDPSFANGIAAAEIADINEVT